MAEYRVINECIDRRTGARLNPGPDPVSFDEERDRELIDHLVRANCLAPVARERELDFVRSSEEARALRSEAEAEPHGASGAASEKTSKSAAPASRRRGKGRR